MKKISVAFILLLCVACAHPSNLLTPVGQKAYKADQIINALGIFQDAAIGAEQQKTITEGSARLIITWTKYIVPVVQQAPQGWKATAISGLAQLRNSLPPTDAIRFDVYINLLVSLIQGAE